MSRDLYFLFFFSPVQNSQIIKVPLKILNCPYMISKNTVVLGPYEYIISLRDIVRNIYIYYLIKVYFGGKMWKCNKRKE